METAFLTCDVKFVESEWYGVDLANVQVDADPFAPDGIACVLVTGLPSVQCKRATLMKPVLDVARSWTSAVCTTARTIRRYRSYSYTRLEISFGEVGFTPFADCDISMWMVRAWESNRPADVTERVELILATFTPIQSTDEALDLLGQVTRRTWYPQPTWFSIQ